MRRSLLRRSLRFLVLGWVLPTAIACQPTTLPEKSSRPVVSPSAATPRPTPIATPPDLSQPIRLVISLGRREVAIYSGKTRIRAYPIAIGKEGWETPIGQFEVKQMLQNPTWINPMTNEVVPTGSPKNPLGSHWIGFWTDGNNWIGFHGTPETGSVGQAASHGCIRMYDRDVAALFSQVNLGTAVTVMQ
ncbi:MAG: L,D-transpeptidase [Leptolyngbyaceae cyanobacterium SU_3_3]|nr:L,D-transpeptidase [Leptolyngbyaceae cyanobacterium SU_3_3]NJR50698.1 L,D-transpeptidase [Leptolyngbyaceae cyanobacterium CSU_1_3]